MTTKSIRSEKICIPALDGFPLHAHVWLHERQDSGSLAPVVVINPATSVQCLAMLDRLMQHHHRITLTGDSRRSKEVQAILAGEEIGMVMAANAATQLRDEY